MEYWPSELARSETADLSQLHDGDLREVRKLNEAVIATPDEYEPWDALVRAVESLEGGLHRNSHPQAIQAFRDVYNHFLTKFPLFFVYWKRWAEKEFQIAGTEAAEGVYERAVASFPNSIDLWTDYCTFKTETCHDVELVRELFERGASQIGLDYTSHPFWDKYLEFEEQKDQSQNVLHILERLIHVPTQKCRDYFDRFRQVVAYRPLYEIADRCPYQDWVSGLQKQYPGRSEYELDGELRQRLDSHYLAIFNITHGDAMSRQPFEDAIKRPYFHVTEIDDSELAGWRKYLDFEEQEGNYERTKVLYERCLVICALYEEFWLRYIRWLQAQERIAKKLLEPVENKKYSTVETAIFGDKTEDVRIAFQRACTIFVPIAKPTIRLQYALFEETEGRPVVARDVHYAVLEQIPGHLDTIVSLANLERRHGGIDAAIGIYKKFILDRHSDLFVKGFLVAQWANMLWKVKCSIEEARSVYSSQTAHYAGSRPFWVSYFFFELQQIVPLNESEKQHQRVKKVFEDVAYRSQILPAAIKEIAQHYKAYLLECGGKDAAKEYLKVDRDLEGPISVRATKIRTAEDADGLGGLYTNNDVDATTAASRLGLSAFNRFPRDANE